MRRPLFLVANRSGGRLLGKHLRTVEIRPAYNRFSTQRYTWDNGSLGESEENENRVQVDGMGHSPEVGNRYNTKGEALLKRARIRRD